jgi:plastocyanin
MHVRNLQLGARQVLAALGTVALAASIAACGGSKAPELSLEDTPAGGSAASSGGGPKVDAATAGEVTGVVTLDGMAPANAVIRMNADPVCLREAKGTQTQETYEVGSDGKSLANVFVYVKDGLGNYSYDAPTESVKLDQNGCRYHPHVFGIRVGQPLEILNSDPTLHNIHAQPKTNTEFNNGQPIQGMKTTHVFDKQEVMVPFKCDVHGWMNAYVGVVAHPYFAVTDKDGKFDLKTLPPGTYTLEAWHEKLGTQEAKVTIGAKETKDVAFTFKAAAAAASN